jgi:pentose-5-phosphate-3-epimerase
MGEVIISPSILGYADHLKRNLPKIQRILDSGIEWLHVDIMRKPFTKRNTFPLSTLRLLIDSFMGKTGFDFHIMSYTPEDLIDEIDAMYEDYGCERNRATITIHREAYRHKIRGYEAKAVDWYQPTTGDESLDHDLRWSNVMTSILLKTRLLDLQAREFMTGLALEPELCIDNVSDDLRDCTDMLLLMGVSSGAGGQSYRSDEVTPKIIAFRERYPELMIQVDGGVNEGTIEEVVSAGADNLVVGSYITAAEDPAIPINKMKELLKQDFS